MLDKDIEAMESGLGPRSNCTAGSVMLRVLITDAIEIKVLEWIKKTSPAHLVIRHEADKDEQRPHWHALFWSKSSLDSLRALMKRAVPELVGNKSYSMKAVDDIEAYERYMCHAECEGGEVTLISAQPRVDHEPGKYSKDWCVLQNKRYYELQRAFIQKKKKDTIPLHERIYEECKARGILVPNGIADVMMEMYAEAKKPFNTYQMRGILRMIYYRLNKQYAAPTLRDELTQGLN